MKHYYKLGLFEKLDIANAFIDYGKDKGYAINQYNWYRKHSSLKKVVLYRDDKAYRTSIRIDEAPRYALRKETN